MAAKISIGGDVFKIKKDSKRSLTWGVFRLTNSKCFRDPVWMEIKIGFKSKGEATNWLVHNK
jgi:hypothetical protein